MFIIEHPGTSESTEIANDIMNMLEMELGHEAEITVGRYEDDITVYTDSGEIVGTFNTVPNYSTLKFFIDAYSPAER